MSLFVSCECGQQTSVSPAKCGGEVRCLCGASISVPPLSDLRKAMAANPPQVIEEPREVDEEVWRPFRPVPMAFAVLLFAYSMLQLLFLARELAAIPGWSGWAIQRVGFGLAFTTASFAASLALYRFARRPEHLEGER